MSGHEFVEHCNFTIGNAAKNVAKAGLQIDAVVLCRLHQIMGDVDSAALPVLANSGHPAGVC